MLIISIDPGINGAICFFENGEVKDVLEMPTMAEGKKNKRQVNGRQMYNELSSRIKAYNTQNINVIVEQVSAMPGQGVSQLVSVDLEKAIEIRDQDSE